MFNGGEMGVGGEKKLQKRNTFISTLQSIGLKEIHTGITCGIMVVTNVEHIGEVSTGLSQIHGQVPALITVCNPARNVASNQIWKLSLQPRNPYP